MPTSLPESPAGLPARERAAWRSCLRAWLRLSWALDSAYWGVTNGHIDARKTLGKPPGEGGCGERRAYSAAEMSQQLHNVAVMHEHAQARLGAGVPVMRTKARLGDPARAGPSPPRRLPGRH